MTSNRILLVGATGYAGRKLAHYLLTDTDATIILSGRSRTKLDELRSFLHTHDLVHRTELLELDAGDFDFAALPKFDLLVNATAEGPHNTSLIQLCLGFQKFKDFICYDKLAPYRNFTGIRIEDNIHVTEKGPVILGPEIPKLRNEVEREAS